jgi:F-type H+-transporting ATPase subunit a
MAAENEPFDPFHHVADAKEFELFGTASHDSWLHDIPLPWGLTKFMVIELVAAGLIIWGFVWLARKVKSGEPPRGRLWNFLEWVLLFIRDQVAKPALGEHDYKRFLPFLWTTFLFILVMNLLGLIPFMGSPTASIAVTGVLAIIAFIIIHLNGVLANHGFMGYMKTFVPHLDTSDPIMKYLGPPITVMMFFLEILTAFIRSSVLAIRLFANMLAGHTVLVIILSFIMFAAQGGTSKLMLGGITVSSIGLVLALNLLELFIACLQAFVFTFLTAIFIGLAMHPQH